MWSHSSSIVSGHSKVASTALVGKKGVRFLVAGTIAAIAAPPLIINAYSSTDSEKQSTTTVQKKEVKQEGAASSSATPTVEVQADLHAEGITGSVRSDAKLKVNNQTVPLPEHGSTSTVVQGDNSATKIDISVDSSSSGSSDSTSTMNIQLNTATDTEVINSDFD